MTNEMAYNLLTSEKQHEFRKIYDQQPLASYIDWQAYFASDDGNSLHFVNYIRKDKDENGELVFVLEELVEDDMDYELVFNCSDNTFGKIPARSAE